MNVGSILIVICSNYIKPFQIIEENAADSTVFLEKDKD